MALHHRPDAELVTIHFFVQDDLDQETGPRGCRRTARHDRCCGRELRRRPVREHRCSRRVGRPLVRIAGARDGVAPPTVDGAALLQGVREFVREQAATGLGRKIEAAHRKRHVVAHGVGLGINQPCSACCPRVGVYSHSAQVLAEARLHKSACRRIKRLAR